MFYRIVADGIISVIGTGNGGESITEAEYNHIKSIISSRPAAPEGFGYRLTESLEWELYEIPEEEAEADASAKDYQNALREMGVRV